MSGYIKPQESELLVREYEQHKDVYCSLRKQLNKSYGILPRFTLSYDCTFLVMLVMARSERPYKMAQGRCTSSPTRKCPFCEREYPELIFASVLSVIMTYHKLRDDLKDPGLEPKLRVVLFFPLSVHAHKKTTRDYSGLEQAMADAMQPQEQTEQQESPPLGACAEPITKTLSGVLSQLAEQDTPGSRISEQFGYFSGRWIYLMDTADDTPKDLRQNAFNPFVRDYGLTAESTQEQLQEATGRRSQVLNMMVSQTTVAFRLLDLGQFVPIPNNIICLGLSQAQKEFILKMEKGKNNVKPV